MRVGIAHARCTTGIRPACTTTKDAHLNKMGIFGCSANFCTELAELFNPIVLLHEHFSSTLPLIKDLLDTSILPIQLPHIREVSTTKHLAKTPLPRKRSKLKTYLNLRHTFPYKGKCVNPFSPIVRHIVVLISFSFYFVLPLLG